MMELNIGTNIKKLRLAKGLTQEQLAGLLNVSGAAVSKWEAKNTLPDITMLFPLASVFEVSVDELMGYDTTKTEKEIEDIISLFHQYHRNGEVEKQRELILNARKTYPNDYRIMIRYLWMKAGGSADNDPVNLMENQEEFLQICDCILDGCTQEVIRLEALTMKAKLLHASGDTDGALALLGMFPSWYQSSGQKTEQLFAKDTSEYRYWNRKNAYELLDGVTNKLVRTIWYHDSLSPEQKIVQIEAMGQAFCDLRKKEGMEFFVIAEQTVYAELAGKLSRSGAVDDVIRVREKQFDAMQAMMHLSEQDEVLKESIKRTYGTEDALQYLIDFLLQVDFSHLAKLRENADYLDLLSRWSK